MEVESEVFGAVGLRDPVPRFGEYVVEARKVVGETQPDVKMRDAACLEFKHPQIMNVRESPPKCCEPGVQVFFDGSTVWFRFVIRHTKLRYESR